MIYLPLNLIVPARMSAEEILRKYPNDLGMVFMYLKFCTDRADLQKMFSLYGLYLSGMKLKTAELIKTITGDDFFYNLIINSRRNGKDGPDMSEGMKQIIEDATAEGKAQGIDQGRRIRDKEISLRLAEKGHSADEIAELIGLDSKTVLSFLPDYSCRN